MKQGLWRSPPTAGPPSSEAEALLGMVAGAAQLRPDQLTVERQRLAGRSSIYVARSVGDERGPRRWVVKKPHTGWSQDDVASPLSAAQEFDALERLHAHFASSGVPFQVPRPVVHDPELGALAMEFVDGVPLKDLLDYRSALRPRVLLDGIEAAGTFLRHLHDLEQLPDEQVDLRDEAQKVLQVADEKLVPLGLALPDRVRRTLGALPATQVTSRQVRLHGDFGPANIILASDGSTVGLDPDLSRIGRPEEDLARFVALVAGVIRLSPEIVVPPAAGIRRRLEGEVLRSYYGTDVWPALFEVTYLHQLVRRWCRLRELAQQHGRAKVLPLKLAVIGKQVHRLIADSERRLVRALEAP